MNDRSDELFDDLAPPRGGLAGLRARIDRAARRQARLRLLRGAVATGAALGLAGLLLVSRPAETPPPRLELGPSAVRWGLRELPSEPVTVTVGSRGRLAVRRVPLESERVVFYLVGSTSPEPAAEHPGGGSEGGVSGDGQPTSSGRFAVSRASEGEYGPRMRVGPQT
jgi:hypothetical protein